MKKNKFKKKRLERPIYMRKVNGTFNYEGLIEYTVEVELFYRGHKEKTEIYVIRGQKQSVILEIPQLAYHNPKINWKEVKIMRCPDKCEKQWKMKQIKLG